jgi:hypothetical protein
MKFGLPEVPDGISGYVFRVKAAAEYRLAELDVAGSLTHHESDIAVEPGVGEINVFPRLALNPELAGKDARGQICLD